MNIIWICARIYSDKIFLCFLSVQTIRQLSRQPVQLRLKTLYGELTKCVVTTNKEKEVSIFPEDENEDNISNYQFAPPNECQPVIENTDYHMNGIWTVKQTYENQTVTEKFNIQIKDVSSTFLRLLQICIQNCTFYRIRPFTYK